MTEGGSPVPGADESPGDDRRQRPGFVGPEEMPSIGPELAGLGHPSSTIDAPFLAEGRDVWATGVEARPGVRVGAAFHTCALIEPTGLGSAATTLHFPGVVRRHFVGRRGTSMETVVVARTLPFVVCQWVSPSGSVPEAIEVRIVPPGGADTQLSADGGPWPRAPRHDGSCVWVESSRGVTAVAASPRPRAIEIRPEGRVVVRPSQGKEASLVVASGSAESVRSAMAAARHLRGHAIRAASGPGEGLATHTGIPEIDEGMEWLRARLGAQLHRWISASGPLALPGRPPRSDRAARERRLDALGLALAAVVAGHRDEVERLLAAADETSAAYGIVAARFASVFGDTRFAARTAEAWIRTAAPSQDPLTTLAARLLVRALDRSWHPKEVVRLRTSAAETASRNALPVSDVDPRGGAGPTSDTRLPQDAADPPAPISSGERHLPSVRTGGPRLQSDAESRDPVDEDAWWTGLLAGAPAAPVPISGRAEIYRAREACARFPSDPDAAWAQWRALLASRPARAVTLWDMLREDQAAADRRGPAAESCGSLTAELVLGFVSGVLGIDADAPSGRMRIAPRLPSHLTRLAVGGLRVGRATLRLEYHRDGGTHLFELIPEAADVPPLVVLEPRIAGRICHVRIDGAPADLEVRDEGGGAIVPVQLPVDRSRTLEVDAES